MSSSGNYLSGNQSGGPAAVPFPGKVVSAVFFPAAASPDLLPLFFPVAYSFDIPVIFRSRTPRYNFFFHFLPGQLTKQQISQWFFNYFLPEQQYYYQQRHKYQRCYGKPDCHASA